MVGLASSTTTNDFLRLCIIQRPAKESDPAEQPALCATTISSDLPEGTTATITVAKTTNTETRATDRGRVKTIPGPLAEAEIASSQGGRAACEQAA